MLKDIYRWGQIHIYLDILTYRVSQFGDRPIAKYYWEIYIIWKSRHHDIAVRKKHKKNIIKYYKI